MRWQWTDYVALTIVTLLGIMVMSMFVLVCFYLAHIVGHMLS